MKRIINWIAPAATLLTAVLIMHRRLVFGNFMLARGDSYLYFTPYWNAAATALKSGRIPLWNPDLFMGAPLLANSQVGMFYPFNAPIWLLFDTPNAVKVSIVLHVFIAAVGMYVLGRKFLKLSMVGAIVAALMYALGGYLTAQVEHINQAQSMAWMPWLFMVASGWQAAVANWRLMTRKMTAVALLFGLQLLAGHTQTTFITGIGICIWTGVQLLSGLWDWYSEYRDRHRVYPAPEHPAPRPIPLVLTMAAVLGTGVLLAVLIAFAQLLPTLELTELSRRTAQGGMPLKELLSFSLHHLLFARAILPGYGQMNYSEYIASVPLIGIILAVVAMAQMKRNHRHVLPPLALLIVGILFGLGEFSAIYRNQIASLPGFDLFRAPSRWMVLYALGVSMLAGIGWDAIGRKNHSSRCGIAIGLVVVTLLIAAVPFSDDLARTIPLPPENPPQTAVSSLYIGWLVELAAILALVLYSPKLLPKLRYFLFVPMMASFIYTGMTHQQSAFSTMDAFYDIRQAVARLQVAANSARDAQQPIPRYLSISKGYFDPGDQGEIDSVYADQLTEAELYLYTTNTKDREIVVPNLAILFGLSAVDGFDGGLLPTSDYATTAELILPEGEETIDGRLRELITQFPDERWLDLFGVRHIIADRIGEYAYSANGLGVTFDRAQIVTLQPGESIRVADLPDFQSTEVWIVGEGTPGRVRVSAGAATDEWQAADIGGNVSRAEWSEPGTPDGLELIATDGAWTIHGLSVVNAIGNTHVQLMAGDYRTLHTGDVKVYENLDVLPRAFMVYSYEEVASASGAIGVMGEPGFDPATMAVIEADLEGREREKAEAQEAANEVNDIDSNKSPFWVRWLESAGLREPDSEPPAEEVRDTSIQSDEQLELDDEPERMVVRGSGTADVAITRYTPEQIDLTATTDTAGLLVLAEAHYPTWDVLVDGEPAELLKVDGMFRGVMIPAGTHDISFQFTSPSLQTGIIVSLVGLLLTVLMPFVGRIILQFGGSLWGKWQLIPRLRRILHI